MAEDAYRALVLANEPHQNTDGCGLASSVRANKAHDGARWQRQVDALEGKVRIFLAHSLEVNREVIHERTPLLAGQRPVAIWKQAHQASGPVALPVARLAQYASLIACCRAGYPGQDQVRRSILFLAVSR